MLKFDTEKDGEKDGEKTPEPAITGKVGLGPSGPRVQSSEGRHTASIPQAVL